MSEFANNIEKARATAPNANHRELAKILLESTAPAEASPTPSASAVETAAPEEASPLFRDRLVPILERCAVIGAFNVERQIPPDAADRPRLRSALIRRSYALERDTPPGALRQHRPHPAAAHRQAPRPPHPWPALDPARSTNPQLLRRLPALRSAPRKAHSPAACRDPYAGFPARSPWLRDRRARWIAEAPRPYPSAVETPSALS